MADTSKSTVSLVVGMVVIMLVIAYLLPTAIGQFYNANWTSITGIDANVALMINTLIPVMIILGIVLAIIGIAMRARSG